MTRAAVAVAIALLCASAPALVQAEEPAAPARSRDAAAMTHADIAACMRANVVERGSLREIRVQATDANGSARALRMKLFWKPSRDGREDRMTLRVVEPREVAGTAYLVVSRPDGEDVYLYMPGVDRVQRLVSGDARRTLLGTDFTYAEIRQVQGLLQRGETRRVADARVFDRPAYVLQTETDLEETGYRRVDSYVDQATCTLLKAELRAKGDTPRKVLEADLATLIEVEPHWLVLGYRMQDRAAGTATRVDLSDLYLLETLPEALFTPASFHRVEP